MAKRFGVLPGPVNRQQITSRLISSDENSGSKKLTPRKKREQRKGQGEGMERIGGEKAISKGNRARKSPPCYGGRFAFRTDLCAVALKSGGGKTRNIATSSRAKFYFGIPHDRTM